MKWHLIAVIVVPVIVGILASLFRGKEAANPRNPARPGTDPRRDRARSDSSGIDQFLEELDVKCQELSNTRASNRP